MTDLVEVVFIINGAEVSALDDTIDVEVATVEPSLF